MSAEKSKPTGEDLRQQKLNADVAEDLRALAELQLNEPRAAQLREAAPGPLHAEVTDEEGLLEQADRLTDGQWSAEQLSAIRSGLEQRGLLVPDVDEDSPRGALTNALLKAEEQAGVVPAAAQQNEPSQGAPAQQAPPEVTEGRHEDAAGPKVVIPEAKSPEAKAANSDPTVAQFVQEAQRAQSEPSPAERERQLRGLADALRNNPGLNRLQVEAIGRQLNDMGALDGSLGGPGTALQLAFANARRSALPAPESIARPEPAVQSVPERPRPTKAENRRARAVERVGKIEQRLVDVDDKARADLLHQTDTGREDPDVVARARAVRQATNRAHQARRTIDGLAGDAAVAKGAGAEEAPATSPAQRAREALGLAPDVQSNPAESRVAAIAADREWQQRSREAWKFEQAAIARGEQPLAPTPPTDEATIAARVDALRTAATAKEFFGTLDQLKAEGLITVEPNAETPTLMTVEAAPEAGAVSQRVLSAVGEAWARVDPYGSAPAPEAVSPAPPAAAEPSPDSSAKPDGAKPAFERGTSPMAEQIKLDRQIKALEAATSYEDLYNIAKRAEQTGFVKRQEIEDPDGTKREILVPADGHTEAGKQILATINRETHRLSPDSLVDRQEAEWLNKEFDKEAFAKMSPAERLRVRTEKGESLRDRVQDVESAHAEAIRMDSVIEAQYEARRRYQEQMAERVRHFQERMDQYNEQFQQELGRLDPHNAAEAERVQLVRDQTLEGLTQQHNQELQSLQTQGERAAAEVRQREEQKAAKRARVAQKIAKDVAGALQDAAALKPSVRSMNFPEAAFRNRGVQQDFENRAVLQKLAIGAEPEPFKQKKRGRFLGQRLVEEYFRVAGHPNVELFERRNRRTGELISQHILTSGSQLHGFEAAERRTPKDIKHEIEKVRDADKGRLKGKLKWRDRFAFLDLGSKAKERLRAEYDMIEAATDKFAANDAIPVSIGEAEAQGRAEQSQRERAQNYQDRAKAFGTAEPTTPKPADGDSLVARVGKTARRGRETVTNRAKSLGYRARGAYASTVGRRVASARAGGRYLREQRRNKR